MTQCLVNYLDLCKRVRQEAGLSGDGPAAVANQAGQMRRIVDWVSQAWVDIQNSRPDWLFMDAEFSFATTAAKRDYTAGEAGITNHKLWDTDTFFIYKTSIGASDEHELDFMAYNLWRRQYRAKMDSRDDVNPVLFTVLPNNSLRFEGRPDGSYTISGSYKTSTQTLAVDADTPTLPLDYHMIIVWQALKYYASYYNAPEVMDEAEVGYDTLLIPLEREQLPLLDLNIRPLV